MIVFSSRIYFKPEPARPDPTRPDPARPDPARPDPARPDPARPWRSLIAYFSAFNKDTGLKTYHKAEKLYKNYVLDSDTYESNSSDVVGHLVNLTF